MIRRLLLVVSLIASSQVLADDDSNTHSKGEAPIDAILNSVMNEPVEVRANETEQNSSIDMKWYEDISETIGGLERSVKRERPFDGDEITTAREARKAQRVAAKQLRKALLLLAQRTFEDYNKLVAAGLNEANASAAQFYKDGNEYAMNFRLEINASATGSFFGQPVNYARDARFKEVAHDTSEVGLVVGAIPMFPIGFIICSSYDSVYHKIRMDGCESGHRHYKARRVATGIFVLPLAYVGKGVGYVVSPIVFAGYKVFKTIGRAVKISRESILVTAPRAGKKFAIQ